MRILHVCQPVDGGAPVVARNLILDELAAGHHVTMACPEGPLSTWLVETGAHLVRLEMTRGISLRDARALFALIPLMAKFDVVYLHSSKAGALGRVAAAVLRRRPLVIFMPHGWSWYVGGRAALVYTWLERVLAKIADRIVVVSDGERADGLAVLPRARQRMVLIENGVDAGTFSPLGNAARRSSAPLILLPGRVCVQKGQDIGVRILHAVGDQRARLRLAGTGSSGDVQPVLDLAEALGVRSRVELADGSDLISQLRAADVILLPSRWEGHSLLLLEAMACGGAIVASHAMGGTTLGDSGIVVDESAGPELYAREIDRLLADADARTELANRARQRVERSFSLGRSLETHRGLLTLAAAHRGGRQARS